MSDEWGPPVRIFLAVSDRQYYVAAIGLIVITKGITTHLVVDDIKRADMVVTDNLGLVNAEQAMNAPVAFVVFNREYHLDKPGVDVRVIYISELLIAIRDLIKEVKIGLALKPA